MNLFDHSKGQYFHIDDARIYFEEAGDPEGAPLLLLHGGLGTITDFNDILEHLPMKYRFIGIDFRGHGRSTIGSESLSFERYQADVEAILDHLNISDFSILGFSDGGIVGYRLAAKTPSRVKKLMTLGAQWRLDEEDPSLSFLSTLTSEMWTEMFPESVVDYEKVNPQPDFDALVKAVAKLWTDMGSTGYPGETVRNIEAPTLIVRGDDDHLLSLTEAVELKSRLENVSFSNIPFSGHTAHLESPVVFSHSINEFLEK